MSRQDEVRELIEVRNKRLHELKKQQAFRGDYNVDPAITLEIRDIETKIGDLQKELLEIEDREVSSLQINTSMSSDAHGKSQRAQESTRVMSFSVRGGVDSFAAFMNRIDGIVKDNLENFLIFYRPKPENTYRNSKCEAWEVYKFACYATVEAHEIVSGTTVIDCWNGKKPHQNYPTYAIKQEKFLNFCHWLFEQARVSGLEPKRNFLLGMTQDNQKGEDTKVTLDELQEVQPTPTQNDGLRQSNRLLPVPPTSDVKDSSMPHILTKRGISLEQIRRRINALGHNCSRQVDGYIFTWKERSINKTDMLFYEVSADGQPYAQIIFEDIGLGEILPKIGRDLDSPFNLPFVEFYAKFLGEIGLWQLPDTQPKNIVHAQNDGSADTEDNITVHSEQIGVIGNHNIIHGGVNFYGSLDQLPESPVSVPDSTASSSYDLGKVRTLLFDIFNEDDLRDYCQQDPRFSSVYKELKDPDRPREIIRRILDHANRKNLVPKLLNWAKAANPTRYAEGQPYETNQLTD